MTHLFTASINTGSTNEEYHIYYDDEAYHFKPARPVEAFELRRVEDSWATTLQNETLKRNAILALDEYLLAQH